MDELLETVLLVAEIEALSANPDKLAEGTVIEAHMDRQTGAVATLLVSSGTLRAGDAVAAGAAHGKVQAADTSSGAECRMCVQGDSSCLPLIQFKCIERQRFPVANSWSGKLLQGVWQMLMHGIQAGAHQSEHCVTSASTAAHHYTGVLYGLRTVYQRLCASYSACVCQCSVCLGARSQRLHLCAYCRSGS